MAEEDLWVEKYRPTDFGKSFISQEYIVKSCRNWIKEGKIPHLILSGPPGVGKTTTAIILADKISGEDNYLMLNASDENSIKVYRGEIKLWVKTHNPYNIIDIIKTLILDEGDNITRPAQQVLRRMLEEFSRYFRLIITCNYPNKIIEPIKSRCVELRFNKLPYNLILKRLYTITKRNDLKLTVRQLKIIPKIFDGDLRKCINIINAVKYGADFKALVSQQNPYTFLKYLTNSNIQTLKKYIDNNIFSNTDLKYIIKRSIDILITDKKNMDKLELNNDKIRKLIRLLAEADYRISGGAYYSTVIFWVYECLDLEVY